ncbi:ATP phosphoribosyltransferase regulatory subunit [Enterococcus caccae]|uniref:ATP phosphoribosyltransferase regulatory subunit n=1 Tax=Enterococcus caccae ATCC BAA-1240 TaxID=1158612 RepID=R3X0B4_9ENTE|nr:ATP phosphoribosyltransferase regulatory subunit [Enterococcus caccae]EOL47460.1 ATP phosphoribosyltransferase, regulatory subunit [Enterococcus caccae ATCC BAA-1240]EOT65667.1 ATP phosphoribosyltransferase, regulatory subunit [Enterococcus caccae ATCC BAA-1240]OJG23782.1 ATP phosphoribosyltransferase, regulatory subunit [Enterococcus caccae]
MKWNRSIPSGTKDKLFREANGAYQLEKKINDIVKKRGYQRIDTPMIEFEDVFDSEEKDEKEFYRFFDKQGRLLVLRPDMTMPIGRVIATTGIQPPLKLSYSGKVFRSNDDMLGEQNELTQAGIELIGYSSLKAEVECISCAIEILEALSIPNFHFELGHAEIFRFIVASLGLDDGAKIELQTYVNNKSLTDLKRFVARYPSDLDAFICAIPRLFGEADEVLPIAKSLLPNDTKIIKIIDELETLMNAIKRCHQKISLTVDLGLVALMDYYTGVLFSGYADLVPDIFLRGGRYDHLAEQFGQRVIPAVGLGINLDTLVALQYQINSLASLDQPTTLVHGSLEQLAKSEAIVKENPGYQLSLFETIEEALKYGKKWQYQQIIEVTQDKIRVVKVGT